MSRERVWPKDSYECARVLEEALEQRHIEEIQQGLAFAYDMFLEYVLADRYEDALALGRQLSSIRSAVSHRLQIGERDAEINLYLGQITALINLCAYLTRRMVPDKYWGVVSQSKYSKPVMRVLLKHGGKRAKELCDAAGLPHMTQLSRMVQPLMEEGLVKKEKYGKNVLYSLTSTGRLVAAKYFGADTIDLLDSVLPALLSRLAGGWQNTDELVNAFRSIGPTSALYPLVRSLLYALFRFGITEEKGGKYRIAPSQRWPTTGFDYDEDTLDLALDEGIKTSEIEKGLSLSDLPLIILETTATGSVV